jgi:hypothetical protein
VEQMAVDASRQARYPLDGFNTTSQQFSGI